MKKTINGVVALTAALFLQAALLISPAYALEIRKQTLPNGLRILHVERHNLPVVMASLLVKASPLNESAGRAGTANLTATLLAEGTSRRNAPQINEEMDFIGASLDASTNSDYTVVSLSVLKKDIEKGFDVFSDVLLNPSFPEEELDRKKELLKGSLQRREEEPMFVAEKAFIKDVFGDRPYGRLVEGDAESIDNIGRDDIEAFYRKYYLPGNAVLSVVGDVTPAELENLVKKYLGKWGERTEGRGQKTEDRRQKSEEGAQKTADIAPKAESKQLVQKAGGKRKIEVIEKDVTQANIILGKIGIAREDPDYYAASVMNYILGGGGFASRLMKSVRDEMGLAYSIYSYFVPNKEPGQFEVQVQTKNESAETVIREILKEIRRIRTEEVSDTELKDAKSYLTGSFPKRFETSRKIADFLPAAWFYNLGDDYIEKYPGYINRVTKEDVLRVAKKYLDPDNYVLVIVGKKEKMKLTDFKASEDVH